MSQNVQRGMERDDERHFCQQIVALLANPCIGPLSVAAIAANLGVSPEHIFGALDTLIRAGQLVRAAPGAYTAPPVVDGEPLRPHPYLAPAATPHSVPEALRGDWLLAGEGGQRSQRTAEVAEGGEGRANVEDAEVRGGRGVREGVTTERTEETEGRERERAEGRDAEDSEVSGAADGRRP